MMNRYLFCISLILTLQCGCSDVDNNLRSEGAASSHVSFSANGDTPSARQRKNKEPSATSPSVPLSPIAKQIADMYVRIGQEQNQAARPDRIGPPAAQPNHSNIVLDSPNLKGVRTVNLPNEFISEIQNGGVSDKALKSYADGANLGVGEIDSPSFKLYKAFHEEFMRDIAPCLKPEEIKAQYLKNSLEYMQSARLVTRGNVFLNTKTTEGTYKMLHKVVQAMVYELRTNGQAYASIGPDEAALIAYQKLGVASYTGYYPSVVDSPAFVDGIPLDVQAKSNPAIAKYAFNIEFGTPQFGQMSLDLMTGCTGMAFCNAVHIPQYRSLPFKNLDLANPYAAMPPGTIQSTTLTIAAAEGFYGPRNGVQSKLAILHFGKEFDSIPINGNGPSFQGDAETQGVQGRKKQTANQELNVIVDSEYTLVELTQDELRAAGVVENPHGHVHYKVVKVADAAGRETLSRQTAKQMIKGALGHVSGLALKYAAELGGGALFDVGAAFVFKGVFEGRLPTVGEVQDDVVKGAMLNLAIMHGSKLGRPLLANPYVAGAAAVVVVSAFSVAIMMPDAPADGSTPVYSYKVNPEKTSEDVLLVQEIGGALTSMQTAAWTMMNSLGKPENSGKRSPEDICPYGQNSAEAMACINKFLSPGVGVDIRKYASMLTAEEFSKMYTNYVIMQEGVELGKSAWVKELATVSALLENGSRKFALNERTKQCLINGDDAAIVSTKFDSYEGKEALVKYFKAMVNLGAQFEKTQDALDNLLKSFKAAADSSSGRLSLKVDTSVMGALKAPNLQVPNVSNWPH